MTPSRCLVCEQDSEVVPLIALAYRGAMFHICPTHLPVLIHDPQQLVGRLQGAERLSPAEIHD